LRSRDAADPISALPGDQLHLLAADVPGWSIAAEDFTPHARLL
jgi:hypothetical protein